MTEDDCVFGGEAMFVFEPRRDLFPLQGIRFGFWAFVDEV